MSYTKIENKSKYACSDATCGAEDCRTCTPFIYAFVCDNCGSKSEDGYGFSDDNKYCEECKDSIEEDDE